MEFPSSCVYYDISFYENNDTKEMDISRYYGLDMDAILSYLTKNRGEWVRDKESG